VAALAGPEKKKKEKEINPAIWPLISEREERESADVSIDALRAGPFMEQVKRRRVGKNRRQCYLISPREWHGKETKDLAGILSAFLSTIVNVRGGKKRSGGTCQPG